MAQFDGLALINAVTNLSELLGRRTTVEGFLSDLVHTVAGHLDADVCSVYLYDVEHDLLVLRATHGLNPGLVGKVRLARGEGLTGHAFLRNSPILEQNAEDSDLNKAIPDLGEEEYPSFLGVPIKRGTLGIGVLTLQYRSTASPDNQTLRALRALASHLAATLENAAALYELHEVRGFEPQSRTDRFESGLLEGSSASSGIAIGILEYLEDHDTYDDQEPNRSLEDAIEASSCQLRDLQRRVDESLSDVAMMIFSSHLLMLRDSSFTGTMIELAQDGMNPREAVGTVVENFSQRFAAIPDPRFQEKAQDVRDLGHRIVRNLSSGEEKDGDYRGHVVVTREVFPSELVKLHLQNVEGIAFAGGGATSHVAILAQTLGLPMVTTQDSRLFCIPPGTRMVIDADDGKIAVAPTPEILDAYRRRVSEKRLSGKDGDPAPIPDRISTRDGTTISLLANVNLVKDAQFAGRIGAGGVGLYRSEFPFLIRNGFPTEDEQVTVYRRVVTAMTGRPVSFRTMDLGGDKLLGSRIGSEENPFLGFRGIRFLLEHRELFRDQLRAMLRAGRDAEISIQFPMVSSRDEFLDAREEVNHCLEALHLEGVDHNPNPDLGVMIEVPEAIEIARDLAEEAEFFSIGSNDLRMYMLAADRGNHRLASLYRQIHPGVLRALARLVKAVQPSGRPISVCGTDAADPAMAVFYLGIGIRKLSVDATRIAATANLMQELDIESAQTTARDMLQARTVKELNDIARELRKSFTGINSK